MKVAMAQINIKSGKISENTDKMVDFVIKAKSSDCDLVVFPEMSDTGYDMKVILENASNWEDGPVKELRASAKANFINIIAGVSRKIGNDVFNGVVVINREGNIVYDYYKTHLITAEPMLEHQFLQQGNELGFFEIEGVKIGLMTCYEIRFPEIARRLALKGADVIIIPAAWPLVRLPHWQILSIARAIENQLYVVATDRIGNDTGLQFAGSSQMIGPYGEIIASGTQIHEDLIFGEIVKERIKTVRNQIKVHQDRRPELYTLNN